MEKTNKTQIEKILKRNETVALDKKWETSFSRRISIALITFVCAYLFLSIIGAEEAFLASFVPTVGFLFSALSLKSIRKIWEKVEK